MPRYEIHLGAAWEPPAAPDRPWLRRFGRPTGVGATDRLVLVCEHAAAAIWRTATLNDQPLEWRDAGPGVLESDVTALLAERNLLAVIAAASATPVGGPAAARVTIPSAWGRLSLVVVSD